MHTNETGSRRLIILRDLFDDCDGWGTLQFWFSFTSKTPFYDH